MKALAGFAFFVITFFVFVPLTLAQGPSFLGTIVPCGDVIPVGCNANDGSPGQTAVQECGVCELVQLGQNIINFFIFAAVVIATGLLVYAGILYLTAGPNPGNIEKAHSMFWNVLIGLIIVLASWIIVDTVMKTLFNQQQFGPWNQILCEGNITSQRCLAPPSGTTGVNTGQAPPGGPGAGQQPGGQIGQPNTPGQECTFTFAGLCIFTGNLGGGGTPNTQFNPNFNTTGNSGSLIGGSNVGGNINSGGGGGFNPGSGGSGASPGSGPAPTPTPPAQGPSGQTPVNPTPPSNAPGGGGSQTGQNPSVQVKTFALTARNFSFSPNVLNVTVGDEVTINLTINEGTHDWSIDNFSAIGNLIKTQVGNVGQTVSVTFTATTVGTFEFFCNVSGHRQLGMTGTLNVQPQGSGSTGGVGPSTPGTIPPPPTP